MYWLPLSFFVLVLIYLSSGPFIQSYKRKQLKKKPFPKAWRQIIRKNVPFFKNMPADLQLQLKGHMQVFLAEKKFFGQDGLEMNDEIRITIAAQACLLILNRKTNYFEKLHSVYVLPTAFVDNSGHTDTMGVWHDRQRVLLGESWGTGKVILSWQHTKAGAADDKDGHNLIIHEFAHQLDQENGNANGAPWLASKRQYKDWYRIMSREFKLHCLAVKQKRKTLIDYYGATNEAEFFAVASETFFERAEEMKAQQPMLFNQLKHYYRVDPLLWV
jgi:MtfA peptidase